MTQDTGWLIEHPHDPRYGRESWYAGKDGFTIDSLQAVRFVRQEDALREITRFPVSLGKNLVARQHSWIPARVCSHGQLQRQCEICDAKAEAVHWRAKAEDAFEPIRKIADALAQGGFHCHDKPGFVADHVPGLVIEAVNELKFKRMDVAQLRTELSNAQRLEDQWVALVHRALVELDQRRHQRTSDRNLLVEILATPDDTTEDSEWLILHARLEKFLFATGERGLKNLLGTVTMLRDRLLDIGNEVLSKQVCEQRDGCLKLIDPHEHVDCRRPND